MLASVKSGRYLQPGHPTGLTGLFNHPSPRSALIYVYGSTLERLKSLPEHSVYRQSTEAITKHRLQIIQSIKPEGYEEWAKRAAETLEKFPEAFKPGGTYQYQSIGGEPYVSLRDGGQYERENEEANAESAYPERVEPPAGAPGEMTEMRDIPGWEGQPPLEAAQCVCSSASFASGIMLTLLPSGSRMRKIKLEQG